MYARGTILTIKDEDSIDATASAYYRVEVVGQSPVQHAQEVGAKQYVGNDAIGVIVKPAGEAFGGTIDEPYGKLRELYDVDHVPPRGPNELRAVEAPTPPTPEDVFREARDSNTKPPKRPRRTPTMATPENQLSGDEPTPVPGVKAK